MTLKINLTVTIQDDKRNDWKDPKGMQDIELLCEEADLEKIGATVPTLSGAMFLVALTEFKNKLQRKLQEAE